MTEQEALALQPGDRVYAVTGAGSFSGPPDMTSRKCRLRLMEYVNAIRSGDRIAWLRLRRVGFDRKGRKFPVVERLPRRVLTPAEYQREFCQTPNTTPNVYADFLEESGFFEAAAHLRKHFPIVMGEP